MFWMCLNPWFDACEDYDSCCVLFCFSLPAKANDVPPDALALLDMNGIDVTRWKRLQHLHYDDARGWVAFKLQKPCWKKSPATRVLEPSSDQRVIGSWVFEIGLSVCLRKYKKVRHFGKVQKARVWLKPSTSFRNSRCLHHQTLPLQPEPLAVRKQPKCASCDTVLFWARLKAVLWKSNARENSHWISAFGVLVLFLVQCTEIITHFKHREHKFVLYRQELVAGHGDDPGQEIERSALIVRSFPFSHGGILGSNIPMIEVATFWKPSESIKLLESNSLSSIRMF